MVTAAQSTIPRTVAAKDGSLVPATIDARTELNTISVAVTVFHRLNDGKVAADTLWNVSDAVRDASAIVTLYSDAKGEIAARVLWPASLTLTKDDNLVCRAYCTMRREWKSFRLDRMLTCHPLTTPDDIATAA